jgi:hypothetical protein
VRDEVTVVVEVAGPDEELFTVTMMITAAATRMIAAASAA